eukprot:CAMPEP_0194484600 /NCGR_PEP_ID=MMETSP0253-20130528/5882_1 /TAXON_ID=2966 /ORGANISM="Noctiluca scintillans" /LENGTH=232 /DNA_ID=CAMNT_0039324433 /DNA_START=37 /DNA_END=735 /DNA_ORIENTATION=-
MVFQFVCSNPEYTVYMGKDKFENEELLKYGFPEDIWFHVDKYSSAHVYLRLPPGSVELLGVRDKDTAKQILKDALDSVPQDVIMEMCQLTKANSIDGCKLAQCDIVYTPFLNLKKEERMDTGQVGFKDEHFRILLRNVEKDKEMVKVLEKTRKDVKLDLCQMKEDRDAEERGRRKKQIAQAKEEEKQAEKDRLAAKELKSYSALQNLDMTSNANVSKTKTVEECKQIEEDFM